MNGSPKSCSSWGSDIPICHSVIAIVVPLSYYAAAEWPTYHAVRPGRCVLCEEAVIQSGLSRTTFYGPIGCDALPPVQKIPNIPCAFCVYWGIGDGIIVLANLIL
eukprot:scaffold33819_cov23-Tisochrysis_lutea.AAC.1